MTKKTLIRRSLGATAGTLTAVTLLGGGAAQAAQPAQPTSAPSAPSAAASLASTTSYLLSYYGQRALMPTWGWWWTELCATNRGSQYGTLKVQSASGAAPEYISGIAPGQKTCIYRWWGGVPVYVTNVSFTPLYVTGS